MDIQSSQFVGSIPENYDRCLGPYIFHDYANDLADRAAKLGPADVLELASGTGILSRKLRDTLSSSTRLTATDLNQPMLDVAEQKFDPGEMIEFKEANAMELPFENEEFDLIVCQFGVMFFPDKSEAFREAARVLRTGGRFLFNIWDSMSDNPFSECAQNTMIKFFPDDPPGFYKVPFGYTDSNAVMSDMEAGGFQDIACETVTFHSSIDDLNLLAHGLVYGNPLLDEINSRGSVDPEDVKKAISSALREQFGPEPTSMPLSATVYRGTAP